ncbi:MAG: thiamine pyrophosphate-dependent dehydrogenase E1 component subunit alpha [Spirochaetia bacterium]
MEIGKEKLADMYAKMMITRKFEETAAKLFTQGKVHGTAHFCIGEEATGIGVCAALEPEDLIYATHRGHGQSIGKGMDVKRMMAEFLGKATGVCRGKSGCMHIAELAVGNLGANGIVAGGIPIAVGSALSTRMQGIDRIVADFFGDGAANEGAFHEALNLAAIWKLPVLFVCVNNQYGMSMHVSRHMAIPDIAIRASSYGMPGRSVDGNDIFQVYAAAREARQYVRNQGPMLLVTNTYRIMGHSKSDANVYRTKEEVEEWRKRCPIKRMKEKLLVEGLFQAAELEAIEAGAERVVREALEFAESSPEPALESAVEDVYAETAG